MTNDIAIKVENLSKYYRLGVINNGVLFRDIQSWCALLVRMAVAKQRLNFVKT